MSDQLIAAERYRKDAAEFSELAKTAETPFICDYYSRLALRYLMHAKNQEKLARISEGFAADRHQDDQIADSPRVRAAAGRFGREPAQIQAGAPRQSQRRHSAP
jgi:hypothetical protein